MIKPIHAPQLSAVKPRAGLNRISDLIPRLIRHYELQAELNKRQDHLGPIAVVKTGREQPSQSTFGWDD